VCGLRREDREAHPPDVWEGRGRQARRRDDRLALRPAAPVYIDPRVTWANDTLDYGAFSSAQGGATR
jgi:hypothetical protein